MLENVLVCHTRSMRYMFDNLIHQFLEVPSLYKEYNNIENIKNPLKVLTFADSEIEVEVLKSIRNRDVFLLAGSSRNASKVSLFESKMELFHAIDAIKRAGARSIAVFMPYFSSSRSDRLTRRNSVGFWVDYKIMVSLGINRIVTFQLHSKTSKTVVDPTLCMMDDVPVVSFMQEYLTVNFVRDRKNYEANVKKNWLFCSVDAGGESLAKTFANCFGTDLIVAHKKRNYKEANKVEYINILSGDDISGREIWIVDDMIDTAGSVCVLMDKLIELRVKDIKIVAIHPLFSKDAPDKLRKYYDSGFLSLVIVADTVEITKSLRETMPFLRVVQCTRLLAEIIITLSQNRSLGSFLEDFSLKDYFYKQEELKIL